MRVIPRAVAAFVLPALCLLACFPGSYASFSETVPWTPKARNTPPDVFYGKVPSRPHRIIGTVRTGGQDIDTIEDAARVARPKGQEVGCDVLISKAEGRKGDFLCAVYVDDEPE